LDSADSALLVSLPPGAYTAEINGLNSTTGVALAEVYEVKSGDPELINISTRAFVNTGSNVEIGGFVVKGSHSAKVLVRAIGPTLSQFGVSGVLAQPSLSVVDSSGNTVASNTGWSTNANPTTIATEMAAVGAFALPSGSADSVLLLTLPPEATLRWSQGLMARAASLWWKFTKRHKIMQWKLSTLPDLAQPIHEQYVSAVFSAIERICDASRDRGH